MYGGKVKKCLKYEDELVNAFDVNIEMKKETKVVCDPIDMPFDIIEKHMQPIYGHEDVTYEAMLPYFETEK